MKRDRKLKIESAKKLVILVVLGAALLLASGCGGGGSNSNVYGGLSGVVLDQNNNPIPGATVSTNYNGDSQSLSSTEGTYLLPSVTGPYGTVYASVTSNGIQYSGQNTYQVFQGQQTKSVNIIVSQTSLQATVGGTVYDRQGNLVGGAQVFALSTGASGSGGNSSSITAVSDNNGNYTLRGLVPNVQYTIEANALGYDSDSTTLTLSNSQSSQLNFNLSSPSGALLNPPTGVAATAFTTPAQPTRSLDYQSAIQNFKRLFAPKVFNAAKKAITRSTPNGNLTEIDVTWTPATDPALYGWGIYRAIGTSAPSSNGFVQLLYDPLASLFADLGQSLLVGQQYTYAVTSINTLYGGNGGNESPMSASATATVLGDMVLNQVSYGPLTFNWQPAQDANGYQVALFDQFPTLGVNPIWTSAVIAGTSVPYSGSGQLVSGNTYYYEVVGSDSNNDQTFSSIGTFTAP